MLNEMPCHPKLDDYIDAYVKAVGIAGDRKRLPFRSVICQTTKLAVETAMVCESFRASRITDYITTVLGPELKRENGRNLRPAQPLIPASRKSKESGFELPHKVGLRV
jgi:hypothetical protein